MWSAMKQRLQPANLMISKNLLVFSFPISKKIFITAVPLYLKEFINFNQMDNLQFSLVVLFQMDLMAIHLLITVFLLLQRNLFDQSQQRFERLNRINTREAFTQYSLFNKILRRCKRFNISKWFPTEKILILAKSQIVRPILFILYWNFVYCENHFAFRR